MAESELLICASLFPLRFHSCAFDAENAVRDGDHDHGPHFDLGRIAKGALVTPLVYNHTNNKATDCAQSQYGRIGFSDDRVSQTEKKPYDQALRPAGHWQRGYANDEPNGKAIDKSAKHRSLLIGKFEGDHCGYGEKTVDNSTNDTEGKFRHSRILLKLCCVLRKLLQAMGEHYKRRRAKFELK
jgi:hypothetical protein